MAAYGDMNPGVAGLLQGTLGLTPKTDTGIVQEAIVAGTPVFGYPNSGNKVWKLKADVSKILFSADLGASNSTVVTVNGVASAAVVYATSHAATMTAIINAIKAIAGVEAVLDSTEGTGRTIIIRTKGATSTVAGAVTGGSAVTVTPTNGLFGQVFKGVIALGHMVPTSVGGTATFAQYDPCALAYGTDIWGIAGAGVDSNEKAYVSVSTGVFSATTTDQDVGCRAVISRDAASGTALIRVPATPVALTYADRF
jgi:hypothetical protein